MEVTISLPEDIANTLAADDNDLGREVLESTALEGYRVGRLSQAQVRRMLGYATDMQVDAFLKMHHIFLEYDIADIERETQFSLHLK